MILGFPCNQFGGQEPGGNEEIVEACQINYGVDFQMFEKVDVNGPDAHEVFQYLKKSTTRLNWAKSEMELYQIFDWKKWQADKALCADKAA